MPRHESHSGKEFIAAREPRTVYLEPEPVWVLDNYRVKRWYYRTAPKAGDKVMYLEDGFGTRVARVTPLAIYFGDSTVMRRPYLAGRLLTWSLPRLHALTTRPRTATAARARTILYV